jgi:hypothetical protein
MTNTPLPTDNSPFARALNWWQDARKNWQRMHELDHLDPEVLNRMAVDVGLNPEDLVRLSKQPDGLPLLIDKRLAALELDPEDIRKLSPLLLRDLERTCAMCADKGRCADDMAADPQAPGWESYCPNSGTLRSLS